MNNNLKPFDLKAALNGEPVMLRDGSKAFVRHHETELDVSVISRLIGFVLGGNGIRSLSTWNQHGKYWAEGEDDKDIIGMYQRTHKRTHTINGFEVPAPERVEPKIGEVYFTADTLSKRFHGAIAWRDREFDNLMLERGLVFLRREDAIANAKAMLGINPHEESE